MAHFPFSFCLADCQQDWHWNIFLLVWLLLDLTIACKPFPGAQLTRTEVLTCFSSSFYTYPYYEKVIRNNIAFNIVQIFFASSVNQLCSSSITSHTPPPLWLIPRRWGYNLRGKKHASSDKQKQNAITAYKMLVMLRCQYPSSVNTGTYESCRCCILGL